MGDIKSSYDLETIKQQCTALKEKGLHVEYRITKSDTRTKVAIIVRDKLKAYHFCDPNLDVIIQQLATFYINYLKKSNFVKQFVEMMI